MADVRHENAATADQGSLERVTASDIERRLAQVTNVLPISHAAREVYCMTSAGSYSAQQLAAAAARDPSLIAELLRMANSSYYNPSGRRIVELEHAIARIGQKRVGQLALAASMSTALTRTVIPWMDLKLLWRRSLAAGVAIELLISEGNHSKVDEGLLLCAIMHSLGRVVLGTLYPKQYQDMLKAVQSTKGVLLEQERHIFTESHAQVMARLLTSWKVPEEVTRPLTSLLDGYAAVAKLPEPLRTKVELLKLAILLGQLSVGQWETWDCIELPPATLLQRLRINDPAGILKQTKIDCEGLVNFQMNASQEAQAAKKREATHQLAYATLSDEPYDFLAQVIRGLGMELTEPVDDLDRLAEHVLFNCLGLAPNRLAGKVAAPLSKWLTIVADRESQDGFHSCGAVIPLPTSYAALQQSVLKLARKRTAVAAR